MSEIEVRHDPRRHRFFARIGEEEPLLDYRVVDERTVDFVSTFTPPGLRGRGIADRIVRTALEWARSEGLRVIPTCWYVRKVLDRERAA